MYNSATGSRPIELLATITSGQSVSNVVDLGSKTLLAIITPSDWTAANLTFQVSTDGITYSNMHDNAGVESTVTAAASRYIVVDPANWVGVKYIKVRSGTSGTPVNQAADRIIKLVSKVV